MHHPAHATALDQEVAAALYQRLAPLILAYLRAHVSTREEAEDLLLEVFEAALAEERLATLPETEQLAWLRRVARHKLVDYYRRTRQRPIVALEDVEGWLAAAAEESPEQVILRREEADQLRAAIARLPLLQQRVLQLRFSAGLRCAQIATLLGKREGTVRVLLWRTMAHLRALYDE